ncbi:MAG: hypothetical protein C4581_03895, partial [Nitrospiraceae bacterium]
MIDLKAVRHVYMSDALQYYHKRFDENPSGRKLIILIHDRIVAGMISGASEKVTGYLVRKIREIDAAPRSRFRSFAIEPLRLLYVAAREFEDG